MQHVGEASTTAYPRTCDCPLGFEGETETSWQITRDGTTHLHVACFYCHRFLPNEGWAGTAGRERRADCEICHRLANDLAAYWWADDSVVTPPPATRDDLLRAQLRCAECRCADDRHAADGACATAACVTYGHCPRGYVLPAVARAAR